MRGELTFEIRDGYVSGEDHGEMGVEVVLGFGVEQMVSQRPDMRMILGI